MTQHARLLRETPIFGAIREDIIDFLLDHSALVELGRCDWLLREGEAMGSMFVVESGELVILKLFEGRQYLLSTMGRGDCIGEMALFDFMPRSASALATAPSQLLEITAASLLEIAERDMEQFALIQMNMGREVTRRLRICEERIFRHEQFPEYDIAACARVADRPHFPDRLPGD